jgi:hypothetical protein
VNPVKTTTTKCLHATASGAARVQATGMWMSRATVVAPAVAEFQGTRMSAVARTRFAVAPKAIVQLPYSGVVLTDGNAGIRAWSPPV